MLTMPPETMRQEALRGPTETDAAYAMRMTALVHRGILHAWDTPEAEGLHASLPVWENWIIFALKGIVPSFHRWEFVDADRAIERGIGLCSQQAIVLDEILRRNGVESDILVLDGHVVVEFTQGTPMILDPDFGVVMQGTPHTIRDNLAMVDEAYPPDVAAALRPIYARPPLAAVADVSQYHPRRVWLEPALYVLKWLLPLLMLVPRCLLWLRSGSPRPATG
jgi:hypothetical protein